MQIKKVLTHEEWGIRKGQYGASDTLDEIEYRLNESKSKINPTS